MNDIDKMMRIFILNALYGKGVDEEQIKTLRDAVEKHYGSLVYDYYIDTDSVRDEDRDQKGGVTYV